MNYLRLFLVCLKLSALVVLGGCASAPAHDGVLIVDSVDYGPVLPREPACGNLNCGVANCDCVVCECRELGGCLPAPVQEVSHRDPVLPRVVQDFVDTSKAPQACRRNADGSWSCGPAGGSAGASGSSGRSSSVCGPQRVGPVRGFVRRLFGR